MSGASNPSAEKKSLLKQTLLFWFLTMLAIRLFHELRRISFFNDNISLFTGIILIYAPVILLMIKKEKLTFFEGSWSQLGRSLFWFLIAAVLIFPPLEILNRYFQDYVFHVHYVGGNYNNLAQYALFQFLMVAIPEEFFYRGYLQPQFNKIWGKPYRFLGIELGFGFIFTCFIFALSHSLITFQWWHFAIFFPSLVFGWLREKTGAITAGALFHALSNIYSYWVILNYHR